MRRIRWDMSAGAVLLLALAYFFDDVGVVAAAVPAVLLHEGGHVLFLWLCGKRLTRVSLDLTGLTIDYAGTLVGAGELLCIAAGPLFGLLYAAVAIALRTRYLLLSGTVSLLLSLFNLLPALPLDGGRLVLALAGPRFAGRLSRVTALLLLSAGGVLAVLYRSVTLLLMGAWLTICAFRL